MVSKQASNAYFQAQASAKIHPAKLIHMLYERLLINLTCACEGLEENDIKKRGENLSKAIAIITELNCCVTPGDESEPAQFLRGMYATMLVELGKVPVNKDAAVIRQAQRYVTRLKEIWEETAMRENGLGSEQKVESIIENAPEESAMVYSRGHKKEGAVAVANMCFLV
ncbi:flagellar export chaperone FliS [Thiovibrio frasassiensis]|uniref:Flagellar export chaperone FliS n=1 Tax=Thiovibrio frasassiensis TaxID=2984131 RepID=A0A9X4RP29_9BACT|nr:flagellar export chaperone FliS [Thiovibrio frasassiensis]MDG4474787.1 flagellar export chaperone FliS [Thiovibrio frasassiensis]